MNDYVLKFMGRKLPFFLAFFLCTQLISLELPAGIPTQQSMEDYAAEKKIDQLLLLIQKRLVIMHEVARTKWNQNLSIEDKVREQQILNGLIEQAGKRGLDEKWVARFFQAQMDAAKEIQKNDFACWRERGIKFESTFSLKDDLRIYIDQINQEMISLLSQIYEKGHCHITASFILDRPISIRVSDAIDEPVWQLAISPFRG